jgi:hypothetical protein
MLQEYSPSVGAVFRSVLSAGRYVIMTFENINNLIKDNRERPDKYIHVTMF